MSRGVVEGGRFGAQDPDELTADAVYRWIVEAEGALTKAHKATGDVAVAQAVQKARKELATGRRRAAQLVEHYRGEAKATRQLELDL